MYQPGSKWGMVDEMCVSVSSNYKDNYNLKSKPALSFRFTSAPDSIRAFTRDKSPLLAAK